MEEKRIAAGAAGNKRTRKNSGFTMVELLVTLAVMSLTILAAGVCLSAATKVYKQSTLTSEAATLLSTLSQAVTDEIRWGADFTTSDDETTLIYTGTGHGVDQPMRVEDGRLLVGADELLSEKAYTSGLAVNASFLKKGGPIRVYLNVYDEQEGLSLGRTFYVTPVNGDSAQTLKPVDLGLYFQQIIDDVSENGNMTATIDSNAASRGSKRVALVAASLARQGVDISDSGIRAWRIHHPSGNEYYLYWTDQDISILPLGTKVRVLRYNLTLGTYTAGYIAVRQESLPASIGNTDPYHALDVWGSGSEAPGQTTASKQSFQQTYDLFLTLPATT